MPFPLQENKTQSHNLQVIMAPSLPEETPAEAPELEQSLQLLSSWRLAIVIGSLCLGILLFGLDTNIIGTAIPRITTEFHSLADVSWYGSSYLLAVTVIQPLFGNLYKFFNVKIVYLISLLVFEGMLDLPHAELLKIRTTLIMISSGLCNKCSCPFFGNIYSGTYRSGLRRRWSPTRRTRHHYQRCSS